MSKIYSVGIIGGGISGAVTALQLANYGIDNILFEQQESLVSGPPFCHLHAGGNLYPDISIEQCKVLIKQSIEMARLFPQSIDERPTFISIPKSEKYKADKLEKRLKILVEYYRELIDVDPSNAILGSPDNYYQKYTKEDLQTLAKKEAVKLPRTPDEWMLNAIKLIDHEKLKTPVFLVQEYGWNLFRLGAQAQLALTKSEKCNLKLNTTVTDVKDVRDKKLDHNWEICTIDKVYKVKYLVNSSGFKTAEIDESLRLNTERLIEFKAAYISKWEPMQGLIPELIFHGERGTPNGMAQLTPYSDNYYQIHGMTKDITLFENGLIRIKGNKNKPEFDESILRKIYSGWNEDEVKLRTEKAIKFVTKFVPSFQSAQLGGPPLYGAQQISGDDVNLRVGEVTFPGKFYARSEIIKASSALTVANQIVNKLQEEGIVSGILKKSGQNLLLDSVSKNKIDELASDLAVQRGYPDALSQLLVERD